MRVLIEEHQYPAEAVDNIIVGLTNLRNVKGMVSVSHVGYYYNPELKDTVFILPKVMMDENEKVFGLYDPKDIIDLENQTLLSVEQKNFLYTLSVWIYRAIVVYRDRFPESDIVLQQHVQQMSKGRLKKCNTFLDILLALQKFNQENQDFFFFVMKNLRSGMNKINWTKTISKSQAFIQNGNPIYLDPVNKKRQINFDEELLVIYFSILNHIKDQYGFPVTCNINFDLIKGAKFQHYLDGFGSVRLRQIKYKYFSDKALYLWELCAAFFDQSRQISVAVDQKEYLLVKNFNIVFEAMIDALVGTDRDKLPEGLADQKDGKIVDHLWVDEMLMPSQEQRNVYYIGDSKYYKSSNQVGEHSRYKQFTYAHNVIQWSWENLMNPNIDERFRIRLRDEETEGYNVIPNFFISAKVDFEKLDYSFSSLTLHDERTDTQSQFEDGRLFDRDTMLLSHYDVNFLYVLALYARNNSNQQYAWKQQVRKEFRNRVQGLLDERYRFYALKGYDRLESKDYIKSHFKDLLGKLYKINEGGDVYTLALKKVEGESDTSLLDSLRRYFVVSECSIDQDPEKQIEEKLAEGTMACRGKVIMVNDNYSDRTASEIRRDMCYGIGLATTSGALVLAEGFSTADYLLLHKLKEPVLFKLKQGPKLVTKDQMGGFPRKMKDAEIFILYQVETEEPLLATRINPSVLTHAPEGMTIRQTRLEELYDIMIREQ